MSFRVWFSRMVWIVAAAVALSGCSDDKKKEDKNTETEPGGEVEDGLAIAISPAAPKAGEKVTITVTVTGEIDGKVNIAVTDCGDGDLAAADHDVTAGKAAVDIPAAKTAKTDTKKCKITAKAKIGDEDMTETHEFAVAEEGTGGALTAYTLKFTKPEQDATGSEKTAWLDNNMVEVTADGGRGDIGDVAVSVVFKCFASSLTDRSGADWDSPTAITLVDFKIKANDKKASGTASPSPSFPDDQHCYLRATAKVGGGADKASRADVHAYRYVKMP